MCCDTPGADPAVGTAAQQQAATAQEGLKFSEDYYTNTEKPLVDQMTASAKQTQEQQQQLFGLNFADAQSASKQYNQYGLPAQANYYDMVNNYSSSDYQEQQAQSALGDVTNASQVQQGNTDRALASRGVSANSGMALYNLAQTNTQTSAASAAAANQARNAAKSLGMNLTAGAAGAAQTSAGQSSALSAAASSGSINSFNAAAGAVQSGSIGIGNVQSAYQTAGQQYGALTNTLQQGSIANQQAAAQSNAATGQAVGTAAVAAYALYLY